MFRVFCCCCCCCFYFLVCAFSVLKEFKKWGLFLFVCVLACLLLWVVSGKPLLFNNNLELKRTTKAGTNNRPSKHTLETILDFTLSFTPIHPAFYIRWTNIPNCRLQTTGHHTRLWENCPFSRLGSMKDGREERIKKTRGWEKRQQIEAGNSSVQFSPLTEWVVEGEGGVGMTDGSTEILFQEAMGRDVYTLMLSIQHFKGGIS